METKVLKGIGAAFPPVPPAHTENWVSDTAWGRSGGQVSTRGRRRCSVRGKAGGEKSATILQPCPTSNHGILSGEPQKILKPFNRVRVGALRLLWARDDFTVTSLAWATVGISFRLTVESVLKVQLASP